MCFDFSIHSRTELKDVLTPPAQPLPFQGKCRYISIISKNYCLRNHKLFLSFMQFILHGVVKPLGLDSGEIKLSSEELGCTTDISRITVSCTNWILEQRQKHNSTFFYKHCLYSACISNVTMTTCNHGNHLTLIKEGCSTSAVRLAMILVWGIAVPTRKISTSTATTTATITSNIQSWNVCITMESEQLTCHVLL